MTFEKDRFACLRPSFDFTFTTKPASFIFAEFALQTFKPFEQGRFRVGWGLITASFIVTPTSVAVVPLSFAIIHPYLELASLTIAVATPSLASFLVDCHPATPHPAFALDHPFAITPFVIAFILAACPFILVVFPSILAAFILVEQQGLLVIVAEMDLQPELVAMQIHQLIQQEQVVIADLLLKQVVAIPLQEPKQELP